MRKILFNVLFGLVIFLNTSLVAQTVFTRVAGGTWNDTNWSPAGQPDLPIDTADLVVPATGIETLNVGTNRIVNQLNLTGTGDGTWILVNGVVTSSNPIMIESGTLQLDETGGVAGNIIDDGTFAVNQVSSVTYAGDVSGTGSSVKLGTSTLTLAGTTSYSGSTTVSVGRLQSGSATAFSPNSAFVVNAILDLNGFSNTIGSLTGGGTVTNSAVGPAVLTVGNDNSSTTFSGVLTNGLGTLGLTKIGTGTLTLSGTNTYTGGTNLLGGKLVVSSDTNLGSSNIAIDNSSELLTTGTSFSTVKSIALGGVGGVLASAPGTTATYGGVISGTGGLTVGDATNNGVIILVANNTYGGATTIVSGTLQLGNAGTTGSITGNITDNGTLVFNRSDAVTFPGSIGGIGSFVKKGSNTLTLSGSSSYSGVTTINAGALRAGSGTALSQNSAFIVNAVLDLNGFSNSIGSLTGSGTVTNTAGARAILTVGIDNSSTTFRGILEDGSGGLGLTKIGAGTLTLSGTNTYTGGTNIFGGKLTVSSDNNLGASNILIENNSELLTTGANFSTSKGMVLGGGGGVLASATGTTATYGGVISGSGVLNVGDTINAGTLVLAADNLYRGGTVLNGGTLVVRSAEALGFGDVVVNGGVLRADPEPINVRGNYTQNSAGTLQLSIGGSAPGQYDFLNVSGHAALGGTLQLISLGGFQPKVGDKLTLILTGGGLSGQFDTVLNPLSAGPGTFFSLIYGSTSLLLEFLAIPTPPPTDFTRFAHTPNEFAVAKQLNVVQFDSREANLISFLKNEPVTDLPGDLEKISPDGLTAFYEVNFSAANVHATNLENRFAEIRNGATGFSSSLTVTNAPRAIVEGKEGKGVIEPTNKLLSASPENRWGVWISGSGEYVNVSGDGNGKSYDFSTGGVTFGLDYRLTDFLAIGVAVDYGHTWTNLTGSGKIDVDSGRGGVYASFFKEGGYANGYVGGGYESYYAQRDALGGGASGSTNGGEFDAYVDCGYDFHFGSFTFGPTASLQYIYLNVSGYSERGSLAPLRVVAQSQDSLRTNVGIGASYTCKAGSAQLTPSLRVGWQHEYLYSALPIAAQFASGAGSVFTVSGPTIGHNGALIDAGLNVEWTPTIGTYIGYNGEVGRSHYGSQGGVCSIHIDF